MDGEVFCRRDNLVFVKFGRTTKKYIVEYLENAQYKIDPKSVLTDEELVMFNEYVEEFKGNVNDGDWNFILSLLVRGRKDDTE